MIAGSSGLMKLHPRQKIKIAAILLLALPILTYAAIDANYRHHKQASLSEGKFLANHIESHRLENRNYPDINRVELKYYWIMDDKGGDFTLRGYFFARHSWYYSSKAGIFFLDEDK